MASLSIFFTMKLLLTSLLIMSVLAIGIFQVEAYEWELDEHLKLAEQRVEENTTDYEGNYEKKYLADSTYYALVIFAIIAMVLVMFLIKKRNKKSEFT